MMPTGRFVADSVPFGPQLGGNVIEDGPRVAQLGQGRNQGKQNSEISQRAGSQERPKLGPEETGITQRKPQASQTQDRVGLPLAGGLVSGKLVRAQVEGPDHDRPAAHRAHDRGINLELLVFARGGLGVQEQEFRPEQADADGTPIEASLDFTAELDIRPRARCACRPRSRRAGRLARVRT